MRTVAPLAPRKYQNRDCGVTGSERGQALCQGEIVQDQWELARVPAGAPAGVSAMTGPGTRTRCRVSVQGSGGVVVAAVGATGFMRRGFQVGHVAGRFRRLDGLPLKSHHCAELSVETLRAAIAEGRR